MWRRRKRDIEEARVEREHAEQDLADTRDRWSEVHVAVAQMRIQRQRNHFAESIASIYQGDT